MTRTKPLIIFDLDGTLLDTQASLADAFNRALDDLGAPGKPVEEFRYIIGDGARVAASRCLPEDRQSDEEVDQCLARFKHHYDDTWPDAQPYPGIETLIESLRGKVHLAVLSNKDDVFTQRCISNYFEGDFDMVLGHRPEFGLKPNPAGGRHIMDTFSVPANDTFLIGDMAIDMKTAVACNISGVGVLWGFRDEPELTSAGASHVIKEPAELIKLVSL